jgi:ABC-2 type transport system ATP-binding protein
MPDIAIDAESRPFGGIVVDQITKTYKGGKIKALNGISLHIKEGEAFGLIGPNGAGKSTFFGCLLAFLKVDSGTITIDGKPTDSLETRRTVGYLPERLNFDGSMTGREFLDFHHELAELPRSGRVSACEELLSRVALQPTAWDLPIKKYSRGMLQRLGLAQALINSPKYLLLDEPASGVDPGGVLLVRKVLKELKSTGMTIVLNSHQLDQVEKVCDRVAFISAGRVEAIENMQSVEIENRELVLKWILDDTTPSQSEFRSIVSELGADVLALDQTSATLALPNKAAIATAIKTLTAKGFPIVHATSLDSRLEKFFMPTEGESATRENSQ